MTRTWAGRPRNHYFADLRDTQIPEQVDTVDQRDRWIDPFGESGLGDLQRWGMPVTARTPSRRGPLATAASLANGVALIETEAMRGNTPIVVGLTVVFDRTPSWWARSVLGQFRQVAGRLDQARENPERVQTLSNDRGRPLDPEKSQELFLGFVATGFNRLLAEHERLASDDARYVETLVAGDGRETLDDLLDSPFVSNKVKETIRQARSRWEHDDPGPVSQVTDRGGISI